MNQNASPECQITEIKLSPHRYPDGNERVAFFAFDARGVKISGAILIRMASGPLRFALPKFTGPDGELKRVLLSHTLRDQLMTAVCTAYRETQEGQQ